MDATAAFDFDLFVIGGGSGGVRCARIAAQHGARVAIAEERHWGGTCVNIGCVPKKLLVMAAEYGNAAADSRGFGWDCTASGHDWPALIAAKDTEIARLNATYARLLGDAGVTRFEARATLAGPHTVEIAGGKDRTGQPRRVTAAHIVLAVGGVPVKPDFPGGDQAIVSDDAFFLPERPRRVLLLGGGYIAIEFAGIFRGLGSEVDLVMRQDLPLRGFDEDLRLCLKEALEDSGIRVHAGVSVERFADGTARLTDGSAIETDLLFAAIGRQPLTGGLGLEALGVRMDGFGAVCVDAESRTSVPYVYAIGDVTNRLNLTPVAIAEGHSLADRLFGAGPRFWALDRVATAVFSSPPIGTVGLTEAQAAARGPADIYLTRFTPMRHTLSGRKRRTMMKLVVDQQTQAVLGAHMIGEDAPEIVQGLSVAINAGATKQDFDRTVGVHPTTAEEFVTLRTRTRVAEGPRPAADSPAMLPEEEMGPAEAGLTA